MAIVIKTLSEQIYDYVFREIRIGHLKYGDKIDENELIDRLGVSRTPIREALIQLSSDNILDNLSRKGFYVRHISDKEMEHARSASIKRSPDMTMKSITTGRKRFI